MNYILEVGTPLYMVIIVGIVSMVLIIKNTRTFKGEYSIKSAVKFLVAPLVLGMVNTLYLWQKTNRLIEAAGGEPDPILYAHSKICNNLPIQFGIGFSILCVIVYFALRGKKEEAV